MTDLTYRSYQKELLDNDDIPFADIKQNMKELNTVNSLLGGHKITIKGVKLLTSNEIKPQLLTVCEIGCGGGDNLNAISGWSKKKKLNISFTGIDIKLACIEYACEQYPNLPAKWITSDYATADLSQNKPAIIFSSLFCHHFNEKELIAMIKWMKDNCQKGFFINDLHRNYLAFYLIKWLTKIFSRSYLVKNDAPLSVARGFKKDEWKAIFSAAGITNYSIQWKWAFRHLIVYKHGL